MAKFEGMKTINGTFGMVYWDGELLFETMSFEANAKIDREDVAMSGSLVADSKIKGIKYEGKMKIKHVYSRGIEKVGNALKKGKDVRSTLVGKLADPDAFGSERIVLYNVWFNELPLMNFEQGKIAEKEFNFGFTDWDMPDLIEVQ